MDIEDCEFYREMMDKYKRQAVAALQLAKEWEEIAKERQELLEQIVALTATRQLIAVSMPTKGDA